MEHPCHRCGSPVQDSAAFCDSCGAPQVRFAKAEVPATTVLVRQVATSGLAAGGTTIEVASPAGNRATNRNTALRSAATAGIIGALLSLLPVGVLAFPLAGFLAVLFYRRSTWGAEPSTRTGFRLGALTGTLGFPLFAALKTLIVVAAHATGEFRKALLDQLQAAAARNPDPQAKQMVAYFMTPSGVAVLMVVGVVLAFIFVVLLSAIGGAASASMLRRKTPPD